MSNESCAWDFLMERTGNPYGVAGLMGNLYVESHINPIDLEGSYARKLGMTSREYTDAVDNGTYTDFVHDCAGYGIAQWTFWSRKEALLKFAREKGVSIGDLWMQLEYLWDEIQKYKGVVPVLMSAENVREASDIVAIKYEKPKHVEEKYLANRAKYGQEIYDRYMKEESGMYSAAQVKAMIQGWKAQSLSKVDLIRKICPVTVGWPYVWGASGAYCTPKNRESYANRSVCPEDEKKEIREKCQVLRSTNPQSSCAGCKYYPNGFCTLADDCQGYIKYLLGQVGITLKGGGCSSMYRDDSNWEQKGPISEMPKDKMCLVFWQNRKDPNVMDHVAIRTDGDEMYECSGEVKPGTINNPRITHYAVPKGLNGDVPSTKPTLRKGSTGPYVVECQEDLLKLGYDLSPYGADGKYGDTTIREVKKFQKANGLTADGITGPRTWSALDAAVGPQPGPAPEPLYTVTIPHLTYDQATALTKEYPGANMDREGGE